MQNNPKQNNLNPEITDISINYLFVNGVHHKGIVDTILKLNRKEFLPQEYDCLSNIDSEVRFAKNKYMLNMATAALMVDIVKDKLPSNILVINSGLGYLSAVLADFYKDQGVSITAVEEDQGLIDQSKYTTKRLKLDNIEFLCANLKDIPLAKKFDLIMVEGAFYAPENSWLNMLNEDGLLVGVLRRKNISNILKIKKIENELVEEKLQQVATPYIKGFEEKVEFIF
jgi:protein-L-isoaspartate O-methyltransferase